MNAVRKRQFTGAHGNRLAGEETGMRDGLPILLLHGGGQTRHAWQETAAKLGRRGYRAIFIDQRGHGESDWDSEGRYGCLDFAADLECVARSIGEETGHPPVVVGASLGGIAAMLVAGECNADRLSAVVLVDITPSIRSEGVDRIAGFMLAHAADGFASAEEAAEAVAAYLPYRPKPSSVSGLLKNLRRRSDGRFVWHWDPRFMDGPHAIDTKADTMRRRMAEATGRIGMPLMLVRGSRSELVQDAEVAEFLDLAPHAEVADVRDAGHMVAGDRNDVFADAVIDFLQRHSLSEARK